MRKLLATLLAVGLWLNVGLQQTASARPSDDGSCSGSDSSVTIRSVNGSAGSYTTTVEAQVVNDRLFVPVRPLARALEAKVDWDDRYGIVTVSKRTVARPQTTVEFQPGKSQTVQVMVNGLGKTKYRVNSFINDDTTHLPFRFLADALDVFMSWDDCSRTVTVDHSRAAEVDQATFRSQLPNLSRQFRLSEYGLFDLVEPDEGFEAYPTVVFHYRLAVSRINDFTKEARNNPANFAISYDTANDRVRVRDKATDQPIMDCYGTHCVVWMNKRLAFEYKTNIALQGSGGGLVTTLATTLVSAFVPVGAVVKTMVVGLGITAAWYGVKRIDADRVGGCMSTGDVYYGSPKHKDETWRIGIVHGTWSGFCIDHYTDQPITVDNSLMTRVDIGVDER